MTSLAVFDFDRTIVDDDSDATIIRRLRDSKPPEWDSSLRDWTPYMGDVFEHAFTSGLSQEDILDCIGSMRPTPGVEQLISTLAAEGWDVLLITDANTVFVHHWLKVHDLQQAVTGVITNRAFWQSGRLYIEPCMKQTSCPRCPTNLCKSLALAEWRSGRQYSRVVYTGDGRNDFCPATNLPATSTVFARRGFPLDALTAAAQASVTSQLQAAVVPWDDCYTILEELFPGKTAGRSIEAL